MADINKVDQAFADLQLQIQGMDFNEFCKIAGINKTQAVICVAKSKGRTLGEISVQYGIPKTTVHDYCKKCSE